MSFLFANIFSVSIMGTPPYLKGCLVQHGGQGSIVSKIILDFRYQLLLATSQKELLHVHMAKCSNIHLAHQEKIC